MSSATPPSSAFVAAVSVKRQMSGAGVLNGALGLWTAAVLAFLYLPILVLVVYSFNTSKLNVVWDGLTLRGVVFEHAVDGHV